MKKPTVDVVICTKDRPKLIRAAIAQVKKLIPYEMIIIIDSSEQPTNLDDPSLVVKSTPNVNLGFARQEGLELCATDLVFCIDDDVILEPDCYENMLKAIHEPRVIAVSGKIIHGSGIDPVLTKLFTKAIPFRKDSESGGLALFKRMEVLEVGGYNRLVHRGEDSELHARIRRRGYRWIRELSAVAHHPSSFKEMLSHAKRNGAALKEVWIHGESLTSIMFKMSGRMLFLPIYYAIQIREPRVIGYYFLLNFVRLASFIRALKK